MRYPLDNGYLIGRNSNTFGLSDVSRTGYIDLPAISPDDLGRGSSAAVKSARLLRVGVEWGVPGNLNDFADVTNYRVGGSSAGAISYEPWISVNAGASWVMLGPYAPPDYTNFGNGRNVWEIPAALGEAIKLGGVTPAYWQVRLAVVGPYAPPVKRIIVDCALERI